MKKCLENRKISLNLIGFVVALALISGCGTRNTNSENTNESESQAINSACKGALTVCSLEYSERNVAFKLVVPSDSTANYQISLCSSSGCFDSAWIITRTVDGFSANSVDPQVRTIVAGGLKTLTFRDPAYAILGSGTWVRARAYGLASDEIGDWVIGVRSKEDVTYVPADLAVLDFQVKQYPATYVLSVPADAVGTYVFDREYGDKEKFEGMFTIVCDSVTSCRLPEYQLDAIVVVKDNIKTIIAKIDGTDLVEGTKITVRAMRNVLSGDSNSIASSERFIYGTPMTALAQP